MPRRRRLAARALSWRQEWELVFNWGGQCPHDVCTLSCDGIGCWSVFGSDEDREAAYWAHREELVTNPGGRCPAFWRYEAPSVCRHAPSCTVPGGRVGREAWLDRHDQLDAHERAMVAKVRND